MTRSFIEATEGLVEAIKTVTGDKSGRVRGFEFQFPIPVYDHHGPNPVWRNATGVLSTWACNGWGTLDVCSGPGKSGVRIGGMYDRVDQIVSKLESDWFLLESEYKKS